MKIILIAAAFTFSALGQAGSSPIVVPGGKDAPKVQPEKKPSEPTAQAGTKVDLRPRFELGQTIKYVMKQRATQTVPTMEGLSDNGKKTTDVKTATDIGLKMIVKQVDKETGDATVDLVYETVKASLDSEWSSVSFDSTKPKPATPPKKSNDPLAALGDFDLDKILIGQYEKLVGATITLTVDKTGKITKATGGDSLVPDALPLGGSGASAATKPEALQGFFGPLVSGMGSDGFAKVGDTWTNNDALQTGPLGGISLVTKYELRAARGDTAEIAFQGRVNSKTEGESTPFHLTDATHTGTYLWDTKRGQLISVTMEQKATISAAAVAGGSPSTNTSTLTLERVGVPMKR